MSRNGECTQRTTHMQATHSAQCTYTNTHPMHIHAVFNLAVFANLTLQH